MAVDGTIGSVAAAPEKGAAQLRVSLPEEVRHASRALGGSRWRTELSVPSIRCGGCIQRIEQALAGLEGVESARANLSAKRVDVVWRGEEVPALERTLAQLGYPAHLQEPRDGETDKTLSRLVRALAVAGFAAGNIMLFSVSVWSGADGEARDLFHWISAMVALPALLYAGQVFFRSAAQALRHGRTNMDVPISIGVCLAFALSLYETVDGGGHVYFEAPMMLLFFLLVGRTLEHLMREKARQAVSGLAKLVPRVARVVDPGGACRAIPLAEVVPGMSILVSAGERVPVDGRVTSGVSDVDRALVTGESLPQQARSGSAVQAGTLNLTAPLTIEATAAERDSFLAEIIHLMERAESARPSYRRIADRAARLYAPVVHGAALAGFAGWMAFVGDLHQAVVVAVAVLIITCPCALALAAPMVQIVAARRSFEQGIVVKDGIALERLAEADTVVFDKTGTLTLGQPTLRNSASVSPQHLALAAAMSAHSQHPLARALAASAMGATKPAAAFDSLEEVAGSGLEAVLSGDRYRLGRAAWALEGAPQSPAAAALDGTMTETVLSKNGAPLEVFQFDDPLRPGAKEAVAALKAQGLEVRLLSGDRPAPAYRVASALGIGLVQSEMLPSDKVAIIERLSGQGRRVLFVGDGLNDAPALTAAEVSMAPGSAADIGRSAASLVFLGESLLAVPRSIELARRADRLVRQNFALALLYNAVALPLAILGFVTPLIAAVAMSSSSIIVVANALRLNQSKQRENLRNRERDRSIEIDRPNLQASG